jgi:DNA-binding XRE family transcriptional regulator
MLITTTVESLDDIIGRLTLAPLKRELQAVAHKLRYPMADILAKVPGDNLTARARKIGVSRQTLYVWAEERFRPTARQAKIIAKLTGVPIEQIVDDGFVEGWSDARKKIAKKAAKVAARADKTKARAKRGGTGGARPRVVAKPKRAGNARKARKRADGGPVRAKRSRASQTHEA